MMDNQEGFRRRAPKRLRGTIPFNTQNFIRMMAAAFKLLGFPVVWSELKVVTPADSRYLRTHHLFVYLLWYSFVIHELFDAISGRVYHNKVLSHDTVCSGNIHLDQVPCHFRIFSLAPS